MGNSPRDDGKTVCLIMKIEQLMQTKAVPTTLRGRKLSIAINIVCCLSIFFFGYDQGMMSGVNNSPDYVRTMDLGHVIPPETPGGQYSVNVTKPTKLGGIVAIYYFGTLWGAVLGGHVGDWWGRVNAVRIGCVWVMLGAALQASAQNTNWMLCARIINGVGTGVLNVIVPVWSAETSDYTVRGMGIAIEFFLNIFGVVVAYWIEYGLSFAEQGNGSVRWRFPIAFQLVPLILLAIFINFMPESPRWLVSKGRDEDAKEVLLALRDDNTLAEAEYQDIKVNADEDHEIDTNFYKMILFPQGKLHISRRVWLAVWFQIIQEWVGIASVTVYQPTIFKQAGFSDNKANWLSGVNNICYMFSTLIAIFTVDRYGRRMLSYAGSVAQAIAMVFVGVFSYLAAKRDNPQFGAASASFVFIFTSAFGATWLTVPWIYQNEIWPVQIRAKGAGWGVVGWSIGNGWLMLLSPVMFDAIQERTFYIFAGVNVGSIAMVYLLYPETANRTLEEIDWLFSADSVWNWAAEKAYLEESSKHANFTKAVHGGGKQDLEKMILNKEHVEDMDHNDASAE
uniref:ARAD1D41998p n=1 Tax=Blastobotrys adeninivorans TaxID=409370 RepID=A0A060TCU3_BLAAD